MPQKSFRGITGDASRCKPIWPAAGAVDTELGVNMGSEVDRIHLAKLSITRNFCPDDSA